MSLRPHCDNCLVKLGSVRTSRRISIDDEETVSVGVAISTLYETLVGHIDVSLVKSPLGEQEDLLLCSGCGEVLSQLLNCTLTLFRRMKEDCGVRKRVWELRRKILKKGEGKGVENVEIEEQGVLDIPVDDEDSGGDDDGCGRGELSEDDEDECTSSEDEDSDYDDKKKKKKGLSSPINKGLNQGSSSSSSSKRHRTSSPPPAEYQCPHCPKHFKHLLPFYKHQQAHKEGKVTTGQGQRTRTRIEDPDQDTSPEGRRKALCPHPGCGKMIQNRNLQDHLITHSGGRPYLCPTCGRNYKTPGDLKVHERTHLEVLPFPCTKCPRSFYRASDLKKHIESLHEFKEPFLCPVCGKQFIHQRNLREHMKLHDESARSNLCCNLCNKVFSRKYNLTLHMRAVHERVKYVKKSEGGGPPRNVISKLKKNEEGQQGVVQGVVRTHSHSQPSSSSSNITINYGYLNYPFQY